MRPLQHSLPSASTPQLSRAAWPSTLSGEHHCNDSAIRIEGQKSPKYEVLWHILKISATLLVLPPL